jgi:hypothetical protein
MNGRVRLVVRITNLWVLELIVIDELFNIIVVLVIGSQSVNKAFQVKGFWEGVGLCTRVADEASGV